MASCQNIVDPTERPKKQNWTILPCTQSNNGHWHSKLSISFESNGAAN
jgi:hypothetical protein